MKALKKALRLYGMTSGDLARKLEVTEATVSRWITGENAPHPVHVRKMIELGIDRKVAAFPSVDVK